MSQKDPSILEKRAWLAPFSWEFIETINQIACQNGGYLHKASSDGFEETKSLWLQNQHKEMTFPETMDFLFSCHRKAPFCFLNGNTFVGIARKITESVHLNAVNSHILRSICGHIVAGTVKADERERLFKMLNTEELSIKLRKPSSTILPSPPSPDRDRGPRI